MAMEDACEYITTSPSHEVLWCEAILEVFVFGQGLWQQIQKSRLCKKHTPTS